MIFVTVGTHEQPFDRLVKYIDELKGSGAIKHDVVIQTGYCTYEPVHCTWSKLYPYSEMLKKVEEADVVITHGGPSSFIMPLQIGKTPIVVPRKKEFDEHVNDHQVEFAKAVAERQGTIIVVEDVNLLEDIILNYDSKVKTMSSGLSSNNKKFNEDLELIVSELFKTKGEVRK